MAVVLAIEDNVPFACSGDNDGLLGLPFGPFDAVAHRSFEIGLRAWVEEQTGIRLGYVAHSLLLPIRPAHGAW
jgi:hypothetical protein